MSIFNKSLLVSGVLTLAACGGSGDDSSLDQDLTNAIEASAAGAGLAAFTLPDSDDYANIPQDPNNPITAEKVALGQMLYHETALGVSGVNSNLTGSYSCASCHHVAAGFKSGVPQGIGEGGEGFGITGEGRTLAAGFDINSTDPTLVPDIQPVTSPSVLNTAYQEVMLWNGQFGNASNGIINAGIDEAILSTPDTPKAENARGFAGLEIQAIAGTNVHRLKMDTDSVLQTNAQYIALFDAAYPNGTDDAAEDAGLAIAAYERTLLANESPFQLWLKGDNDAMSEQEKRGALLFFGDAGCADCHTGPALSSPVGATADQVFMAIGFSDFDPNDPQVHNTVDDATSRGRGGFTGVQADDFKFKVPQLYNLADTDIFGHGASFRSIRAVIEYKNAGVSQKDLPANTLSNRFVPLGLSESQMDDLTAFLETGLYDANLSRYVPTAIPSGNCFPVNDATSQVDLGCVN